MKKKTKLKRIKKKLSKKLKAIGKIVKELKKKKWSCASCEELLIALRNPALLQKLTVKEKRKSTNGRKRRSNPKLKEVMRLHHKEGYTLKQAWAEVR